MYFFSEVDTVASTRAYAKLPPADRILAALLAVSEKSPEGSHHRPRIRHAVAPPQAINHCPATPHRHGISQTHAECVKGYMAPGSFTYGAGLRTGCCLLCTCNSLDTPCTDFERHRRQKRPISCGASRCPQELEVRTTTRQTPTSG